MVVSNKKQKILLVLVVIAVFVWSIVTSYLFLSVKDGKISYSLLKNKFVYSKTEIQTYAKDFKPPKGYIVQSGSMEPSIKVGSIVLSLPVSEYSVGDVITFASKPGSKNLVTHRIMTRDYPDGVDNPPVYKTSGDANEDFDPGVVNEEQIVGKVFLTIPYLGYAANYAKQPYGFILLVIVPATIVIYEELKNLFGGVFGGFKLLWMKLKRKRKDENIVSTSEEKEKITNNFFTNNKDLISKSSVLLPVMGALLFFTGMANAYFNDREGSSGNVLQAGVWGAEVTTAQVLVIHEVLPSSNCVVGNGTAQWVEIYNGYQITVNLQNFKIRDGNGDTVALVNAGNLNLDPGEFALLSHDNATWTQCYNDNEVLTGNFGTGDLDLNTGVLELLDSNNVVIDRVEWGSSGNPDPQINESIERVTTGLDTATGSNWNPSDFDEQCPPTPGFWQITTGGCEVVINEINWGGSHLTGTDGANDEWIELRNLSLTSVDISGWHIEGAVTGSGSLNITSGNINGNGYFLISNFDENTSRINVAPDLITTTIQLDNTGAQYILRDNHGNIVDIADDKSGNPPAGSSVAPKKSMERVSSPGNGTSASDWQTATNHTNMDGSNTTDEFGTPKSMNGI